MSRERQAQWTHRLERLQTLRERFMGAKRYDRAYRAYLAVQRLYDRWADEVFANARG
jgi:hypothetical protein